MDRESQRHSIIIELIVGGMGRISGFFESDRGMSVGKQSVLTERRDLPGELAGRPQEQIQRLFGTLRYESYKRSDVPRISNLEIFVVGVAVLFVNNYRWITGLHEDHVHEQTRRSTVSVGERMDVYQLVMRQSRVPAER